LSSQPSSQHLPPPRGAQPVRVLVDILRFAAVDPSASQATPLLKSEHRAAGYTSGYPVSRRGKSKNRKSFSRPEDQQAAAVEKERADVRLRAMRPRQQNGMRNSLKRGHRET